METAANTAQKANRKGQPKGQPPICKEEAEQLAKPVGSNAWAKKKKKAEKKGPGKQDGGCRGLFTPTPSV
jgi:hypothetical protein